MSSAQVTFGCAHSGDVSIIKISGRAICNATADFGELLKREIAEGYRLFILDVSECIIMDSTFVGMLVYRLEQMKEDNSGIQFELFRPVEKVLALLDDLGATDLFLIVTDNLGVGKYDPFETSGTVDKLTLLKKSIQAHETLLGLSIKPETRQTIESLLEMMRMELQTLE